MQFILLPQLNKHVDCLFAVYHVTSVTVHNDVGYKHLDLLTLSTQAAHFGSQLQTFLTQLRVAVLTQRSVCATV